MELSQKRLLTPKEAQAYLNLSKTTIYQFCNNGELPVIRFGKKILIDREKLDQWIDEKLSRKK